MSARRWGLSSPRLIDSRTLAPWGRRPAPDGPLTNWRRDSAAAAGSCRSNLARAPQFPQRSSCSRRRLIVVQSTRACSKFFARRQSRARETTNPCIVNAFSPPQECSLEQIVYKPRSLCYASFLASIEERPCAKEPRSHQAGTARSTGREGCGGLLGGSDLNGLECGSPKTPKAALRGPRVTHGLRPEAPVASASGPRSMRTDRRAPTELQLGSFFIWIARNPLKSHEIGRRNPRKPKPIFLVRLGLDLVRLGEIWPEAFRRARRPVAPGAPLHPIPAWESSDSSCRPTAAGFSFARAHHETAARPPQRSAPRPRQTTAVPARRASSQTASHRCRIAFSSIIPPTYAGSLSAGISATQVTPSHDQRSQFSYCSKCPKDR